MEGGRWGSDGGAYATACNSAAAVQQPRREEEVQSLEGPQLLHPHGGGVAVWPHSRDETWVKTLWRWDKRVCGEPEAGGGQSHVHVWSMFDKTQKCVCVCVRPQLSSTGHEALASSLNTDSELC